MRYKYSLYAFLTILLSMQISCGDQAHAPLTITEPPIENKVFYPVHDGYMIAYKDSREGEFKTNDTEDYIQVGQNSEDARGIGRSFLRFDISDDNPLPLDRLSEVKLELIKNDAIGSAVQTIELFKLSQDYLNDGFTDSDWDQGSMQSFGTLENHSITIDKEHFQSLDIGINAFILKSTEEDVATRDSLIFYHSMENSTGKPKLTLVFED